MTSSPLTCFRDCGGFIKSTAVVVTAAFVFVFYSPGLLAAKHAIEQPPATAAARAIQGESDEEKLANTLQAIKEHVAKNKEKIAKRVRDESGLLQKSLEIFGVSAPEPETVAELMSMNGQMLLLHDKVMANFKAIEEKLKTKGLPEEILKRHHDAVDKYYTEYNKLRNYIDQLKGAGSLYEQETAVNALDEWLKDQQFKPEPKPFDPNDLPNKSLQPQENNKPKTTKQDFISAGLRDNPTVQLAALGDFTFDKLPGASDPAFLAETVEVRLSDAIKAKAAELGHDPIQIHNWVRNNTEWLPTWGSMQDSDLTISSLKGNTFDIASLEIALLRASGIPSRYVHGTIEVPADEFMNWAGGFTDIIAAGTFVRSGGVPAVGVTIGGKVEKVRMEHIWVEAAIDYEPSRGAVNRDANTWIEMDPAFKQYEFLIGLDPTAISGLDLQAVTESYFASGTVEEDWVQGLDDTILEFALDQSFDAQQQFLNTPPKPSAEEVLGRRKIIIQKHLVLPSALPNPILVTGTRYGIIPAPLQHQIAFAFATDFFFGNLLDPITFPWPALNNQKVTLSFSLATPEDEQTVLSLLPEGEIVSLNQLPTQIPAYLVKVVPELRINGELQKQGSPIVLGERLPFSLSINMPGFGTKVMRSPVTAGSYIVIPVVGGSVAPDRLEKVISSFDQMKLTIQSLDIESLDEATLNETLFPIITQEKLYGEAFYGGALSYFAKYITIGEISSQQQNAHFLLAPSTGTYGYVPTVESFFGVPRIIRTGGAQMDLFRIVTVNGTSDGDKAEQVRFVQQMGVIGSAMEHSIPEQMFSTPENTGEGVSAMKALSKAAAQGQRIYSVTPQNQATTLPNIHHQQATMNAIKAAVAANKTVFTHTDPINVSGFTWSGYVVIDPETGDGGYIISGGLNGGFFAFIAGTLLGLAASLYIFLIVAVLTAIAALVKAKVKTPAAYAPLLFALVRYVADLVLVFVVVELYLHIYDEEDDKCFLAGFNSAIAAGRIAIAAVTGKFLSAVDRSLVAVLKGLINQYYQKGEECFARSFP